MVEYGPVPEGRADEYRAFVSYAFAPEEGPVDSDEEVPPPATVGDPRGLFDSDGELLSVARHHRFDARLRGDAHRVLGLSAVATPPEHRRRGLVRRLLREALVEARTDGVGYAALWPFSHPFYAKFGWAVSNEYAVHECAPDAFDAAREDDRDVGRVRPLDADEWAAMADVLAAADASHELAVDRDESWWRKRVFADWGTDPYVYGWTDADGRLRGYLVYTVSEDDDSRTLRASEFAAADETARRRLLGFLADHDSQVDSVRLVGPPDTSLFHRLDDPDALTTRLRPGPMVRLVDVESALAGLDYPAGVAGTLTLRVRDDFAEWNDATWRLDVSDGRASVERVQRSADATLDVGALAQLVVGYRDAASLARTDELDADADADISETLDAAFPASEPYLREVF